MKLKKENLKIFTGLFNTLEEKFQFPISRYFWHAIIALASIAMVVGFLMFLWGATPTLESSVNKDAYPEEIKVSEKDVLSEFGDAPTPIHEDQRETEGRGINTEDESNFNKFNLAPLKKQIPNAQWKDIPAQYKIGYFGEYKVKDAQPGLESLIPRDLKKFSLESSNHLIKSLSNFIASFPKKKDKYKVFQQMWDPTVNAKNTTSFLNTLDSLKAFMSIYESNKLKLLKKISRFAKKNPTDGSEIILTSLPIMKLNLKSNVLFYHVAHGYTQYESLFNSISHVDEDGQQLNSSPVAEYQKVVQNYLSLKKLHPTVDKSFKKYIEIFIRKSQLRAQKINSIEKKYEIEKNAASSEYLANKVAKTGTLTLGMMIFGGSIVAIAFFALLLVLLSIQRTLIRMERKAND